SVIAALNPATVSVPGTSTLTVSAPSGAVPGFYTLELNGTSSSPARTHSAFADILVIGPDFALSANPDPLTIMAGSSGASTISLTSILGFSGTVSLTASSSDPELIPTLSQASISGSQTSTLSVAVAPGTVPGDFYSVQVNGTSGQLTHSIYLVIRVTGPGFYITANPSAITVNAGTSTTSKITITPTNGFNSPIDLLASAPTGLTARFLPATITPPATTSNLTVAVDPNVTPGTYTVDIQATGGKISHTTQLIVKVVGFSLAASPDTLT